MFISIFTKRSHGISWEFKCLPIYQNPKKGILDVRFFATADQATSCSFTNHYYFNLDASETTKEHFLKIKSKYFLGRDKDLIPTKKIKIKKKRNLIFKNLKK